MNIDHLREFSFLADSLNFSATAKHFFLSQSVLSKHIAAMEDELHTKLFERNSHKVSLTEQGKIFQKDASYIVRRYDCAVTHLRCLEEGYTANLDICYLRGASRPFLHLFLSKMRKYAPEVHVNLRCCEFWEIRLSLGSQNPDLVFSMDFFPEAHEVYRVEPLYTDRFDAVARPDHPIHKELVDGCVSLESLKDKLILLPDEASYGNMTTFIRDILPDDLPEKNLDFYPDVDTAMLRVHSSDRIGFSSEHNIPLYRDLVDFIPLAGVDTSYEVSAFVSKDSKRPEIQTCNEIIEELQRYMKKHSW